MAQLTFDRNGIRGLSIRVAFAKGKVLSITDEFRGGELMIDAIVAAMDMGMAEHNDAAAGPPVMFVDEPALRMAWLGGLENVQRDLEMGDCRFWRRKDNLLCPIHDI